MSRPNNFIGCHPKDRGFTHEIRTLLRSVWTEDQVNEWLLAEKRTLDGLTVVAAIQGNRHDEVYALVLAVMGRYAVHVPALDRPTPYESISERMPA